MLRRILFILSVVTLVGSLGILGVNVVLTPGNDENGVNPKHISFFFAESCLAFPVALVLLVLTYIPKSPLPYCTKCGYDLRFCPDRCPECGQERIHKRI
jgi:hypothetical protein